MSEIFNIVLIKPNQSSITYTFNDAKSKSIKKKQISFSIYRDDSIQRIKEKIYIYTDIKIPLSEMYLFKKRNIKFDNEKVYKNLTQDNFLELDNNRLKTLFNNCDKKLKMDDIDKKVVYNQIDIDNIIQKLYIQLSIKMEKLKKYI